MSSIQVVTQLKTPSPMKKMTIVNRKSRLRRVCRMPSKTTDRTSSPAGKAGVGGCLPDKEQEHRRAHDCDHAVNEQSRRETHGE